MACRRLFIRNYHGFIPLPRTIENYDTSTIALIHFRSFVTSISLQLKESTAVNFKRVGFNNSLRRYNSGIHLSYFIDDHALAFCASCFDLFCSN